MDFSIILLLSFTVMAEGVCYFGPDPNCYHPCRCNDAPVGAYSGGVCDSQTGVCASGCMFRPYKRSGLLQQWSYNSKSGCIEGWNLAEGKPASQSNGSPTEAAKALDYYDDREKPGSGRVCTSIYSGQSHVGAWWRVDLGSMHRISYVYVYGSYDSAEAQTLEHITVGLSEGLTPAGYNYRECSRPSSWYRQSGGDSYHSCNSDNTRHLIVQKSGGDVLSHLTICEVEVVGRKYYNIGTDCSRCIDTFACNYRGFCTSCKPGFYGPKCEGLNYIKGGFKITGNSFDSTLMIKASLPYQELKAKLSTWLGRTCPDESNGCYNKLSDVTFSSGSIQADYTMEVLESQTDHSVLLTIFAMIDNGTFTGNDKAYVINGTTVKVGKISAATLFKSTNGSVRVTTDTYYGNNDATWQGLISSWFDYYCRADRIIPTIFCEVVTTSLNYKQSKISLDFTMKLSTSIDDELFFKTWRDAIQNDDFANRSYSFDHLSFGIYSDHCESSPCQFGGTCLYSVNSYNCLCLPGVTVLSCETNSDECASSPCLLNQTCVDEVNGYNCVCPKGYTGSQCETDINECLSSLCSFGSTCVDEVNGYSCRCVPGYTGTHCRTDFDECASSPCLLNQTCMDDVNRYKCVCPPGYTGSQCEQDINECLSSPCLFGSTCVDKVNRYSCRCVPGYTGTQCGTDVNECSSSPCLLTQTCVDEVNGYNCVCFPGYTGSQCESDINECLNNPCLFGSTCVNKYNGYSCVCAAGYNGSRCEIDINECLSSPCLFGSTCVDKVNRYSCRCVPGYTGTQCGTDVNECSSSPCLLTQTCVDEVNGYNCVCFPGYTGSQCESDINECLNNPCLFGSTCVNKYNGYSCVCAAGYNGSRCEIVKLTSYFPTYGPVAGGTNVILTGTFTDIKILNFTLQIQDPAPSLNDSHVCITVSWNNTHVLMTTPKVDESYGGVKCNIVMSYTDLQGVNNTINSGMVFTYKPNPAITGIYPRQTIISGGIKLTATGTNFDSVSDPVMTVTVEERIYTNPNYYKVDKTTIYISENTTVMNSTSIVATTPAIPQSSIIEPQNTSYQHQQNVAFLGFNLDGLSKFQNLSEELGHEGTIRLFDLPQIQGFGNDVLMYDAMTDTHIEIKGEKLTHGATISDFTVAIGDGFCEVQTLLDNAVICAPPELEPKAVVVDRRDYKEGRPFVLMYIGNAKFKIGYIEYIGGTSVLLYTLPPVMVLIIILVVIIGIVFLCKKIGSNNNQPNDSPRAEDNSTMPTNITSGYLTPVSSSNIDSNNLHPSSSQEATGHVIELTALQHHAATENRPLDGDDYLEPLSSNQLEASRIINDYLEPNSANQPEASTFNDDYLDPNYFNQLEASSFKDDYLQTYSNNWPNKKLEASKYRDGYLEPVNQNNTQNTGIVSQVENIELQDNSVMDKEDYLQPLP